jgi:hypothetical protein
MSLRCYERKRTLGRENRRMELNSYRTIAWLNRLGVPHFYSPILKLLSRHDDNRYWCRSTWRGDDRLGLPHHTSAIPLKYEDHWRFLCKTCKLVQAVRATNIPLASVYGSTDILYKPRMLVQRKGFELSFFSILGLGTGHFDRLFWFASFLQAIPNRFSIIS